MEAKKALEPIMPLCTGWRCLRAPPAPSPFLSRAALRCQPTPQTMHAAFALVAHDHLRCVCRASMVGWVPNVPYLAESSRHSGELEASAPRAWTPRRCSDVTQPGKQRSRTLTLCVPFGHIRQEITRQMLPFSATSDCQCPMGPRGSIKATFPWLWESDGANK